MTRGIDGTCRLMAWDGIGGMEWDAEFIIMEIIESPARRLNKLLRPRKRFTHQDGAMFNQYLQT